MKLYTNANGSVLILRNEQKYIMSNYYVNKYKIFFVVIFINAVVVLAANWLYIINKWMNEWMSECIYVYAVLWSLFPKAKFR